MSQTLPPDISNSSLPRVLAISNPLLMLLKFPAISNPLLSQVLAISNPLLIYLKSPAISDPSLSQVLGIKSPYISNPPAISNLLLSRVPAISNPPRLSQHPLLPQIPRCLEFHLSQIPCYLESPAMPIICYCIFWISVFEIAGSTVLKKNTVNSIF